MGRHSDSEEEYKRRRRSRSSSHSSDRKSRKKKSKRKHDSSPSGESRSRRESDRSKHHGKKRRSRSRSSRRSSSRERRKHKSRHHESSRSIKKYKHKKSRDRSRSDSRTRNSSYASDSRGSSIMSSSRSERYEKSGDHVMTAANLAEQRLQQALKAAAAADETLRSQGVLKSASTSDLNSSYSNLTLSEQQRRIEAISDIDKGDFVQSAFRSNRNEIPLPQGSSVDACHTGAIFSSARANESIAVGGVSSAASKAAAIAAAADKDSLMHPNLYIGMQEKMENWRKKLRTWRRKKIIENGGVTP